MRDIAIRRTKQPSVFFCLLLSSSFVFFCLLLSSSVFFVFFCLAGNPGGPVGAGFDYDLQARATRRSNCSSVFAASTGETSMILPGVPVALANPSRDPMGSPMFARRSSSRTDPESCEQQFSRSARVRGKDRTERRRWQIIASRRRKICRCSARRRQTPSIPVKTLSSRSSS